MPHRQNDPIRQECYRRLKQVFSSDMAAYLRQHPERIDEQRTREGITFLMAMLQKQLDVLEDYQITRFPE